MPFLSTFAFSRWAWIQRSLGAVVLAMGLVACSGPAGHSLPEAGAAYERQDYTTARSYAMQAQQDQRLSLADRTEAAYIAGMSAWRLGDRQQAATSLTMAAGSPDRELSGQANAALGLLYAEQNRHELAAQRLLAAADRLEGDEKARALFFAAVSQQKLGQGARARSTLIQARELTNDPQLRQQAEDLLGVSGYTLQVGAYANRANAQRQADRLLESTRTSQLGLPRVVSRRQRDGQLLYLVHIGQFSTSRAANDARQRLTGFQAVVVPMGS